MPATARNTASHRRCASACTSPTPPQVEGNYRGKGVHEAARIAGVANGSEIVVSRETIEQSRYKGTSPRSVELKGLSQPVDVVSVEWQ